jgi:hypothetical protein
VSGSRELRKGRRAWKGVRGPIYGVNAWLVWSVGCRDSRMEWSVSLGRGNVGLGSEVCN